MSTGRFILRGWNSQGYRAAGRALADSGQVPSTRFGRFVAGEIYQSGVRIGGMYQSGITRADVYQSSIIQGQVQ